MTDETQDVATEVDPSTPIANAVVADEHAAEVTDTAAPVASEEDDKEEHVALPDRSLPEGVVIR